VINENAEWPLRKLLVSRNDSCRDARSGRPPAAWVHAGGFSIRILLKKNEFVAHFFEKVAIKI
jgi:hypothetical protein